ncbi:MAG: hypothetical protein Q9170_006521 [Blastenia crenularia]
MNSPQSNSNVNDASQPASTWIPGPGPVTPPSSSPPSLAGPLHPVKTEASTASFKKCILDNLNQENELFAHLYRDRGLDKIVLGAVGGTIFTIQTTDFLLEHPKRYVDDNDSCYIQIEHRTTTATTPRVQLFRQDPNASDGDFFLPLGWLVESAADGCRCPTRYVCLLNISSQPMSVWLMYDYVVPDTDNDRDIELQNTVKVYDDSIDGEFSSKLGKARDLVHGLRGYRRLGPCGNDEWEERFYFRIVDAGCDSFTTKGVNKQRRYWVLGGLDLFLFMTKVQVGEK